MTADADERMTAQAPGSLTAPVIVIDDFMPIDVAKAMRADIEAHFSNPNKHLPQTHQIWNYWFVPGLYTYMKTQPEKVIRPDRAEQFVSALVRWSSDTLGLAGISWPFLSLYVNGCSQDLHNDSKNGRFAYVYSLTSIERRTQGGETIVFREGDPFRKNLRTANAGHGLYELIEPRFNRLVVFDDRLVHGVKRVSGSMDPVEGRFVMHGHIEEAGPIIAGPLPREVVGEGVRRALGSFAAERLAAIHRYHGPIVLRFAVTPDGKVTGIRTIVDRVFQARDDDSEWQLLKAKLLEAFGEVAFAAAPAETIVTVPMTFGGPVQAPRA